MPKKRHVYTILDDNDKEFIRMNGSKMYSGEIALLLNCSIDTVERYRRKFGVPPMSVRWDGKEDEICRLWNEGYTSKMLGIHFGCSYMAINSIMFKLRRRGYNLPKRRNKIISRKRNASFKENK